MTIQASKAGGGHVEQWRQLQPLSPWERVAAGTVAERWSGSRVRAGGVPVHDLGNPHPGPLPEGEGGIRSAPAARGHDSPELKEAFTDFVGQTFFGELLKQMRATVDKSAFFHGGMGEDIFQSQLDQILVERITDTSGPTFSEPMYQLLTARRT